MAPFVIYALAGFTITLHLLVLSFIFATASRPQALTYLALAGALTLIAASAIAAFRPHRSHRVALVGSLATLAFYLPALRATLGGHTFRTASSEQLLFGFAVAGIALLSTVYSAIGACRPSSHAWLLPDRISRGARVAAGVLFFMAVALLAGFFKTQSESIWTFEIPPGYVGWIRVDFGQTNTPPALRSGNRFTLKIPSNGVLRTSTAAPASEIQNRYYYGAGRTALANVAAGFVVQRGKQSSEFLFVGSSEEYKRHASDSTAADGMPLPQPLQPLPH